MPTAPACVSARCSVGWSYFPALSCSCRSSGAPDSALHPAVAGQEQGLMGALRLGR
jgi:hypothetical protein